MNEKEIEQVFTDEDINFIINSTNSINYIYNILEKKLIRKGILDIDTNVLMAISEFHTNNLQYLKETYNLPINIQAKLMNLLSILLNLKEETTEPNFSLICKNKISEIKHGLISLGLVYSPKNAANFWLKNEEIAKLLDYINTFYFPFIRLYYHFINIEKITESKKIELIINKPSLVPPLNIAVEQIQERNQIDKEKLDKSIEKIENEKNEENFEEKKEERIESYAEIMNKLNMNENIKNIIKEKVEELHKDIDFKIDERQKILDEKIKEVEENLKKKK